MHPIRNQRKRKRIVALASKYLKKNEPPEYQLVIDADSIQEDDDWYYVVVTPSRTDIRSYDYSARLADAELDMQENEKVNVLLVPALPN